MYLQSSEDWRTSLGILPEGATSSNVIMFRSYLPKKVGMHDAHLVNCITVLSNSFLSHGY